MTNHTSKSTPLTQRYILSFWLPLAASWMLMASEGPLVQAAIARLQDPEVHLAAFGIVTSLSITIEAPIIMLLATSTALCRNRAAYRVLRRFMLWLNLLVTVVAAAVAFTPLFDLIVPGLMGVPEHIAEAARPGMGIMTMWSAVIGWRRFFQGILIRFGETRRITYGTAMRLCASVGTAVILALWGELPGVWVGGCALMAGVTSEALLLTRLARPVLITRLGVTVLGSIEAPEDGTELTMRRVTGFHTPLAATSLLTLFSQPMVGAALTRAAFPERSLAAWPVAFSVTFLARSLGMAVQEVVIALTNGPKTFDAVRRFVLSVSLGATLMLALMAFTPLADLYLAHVTGISDELADFVAPGLQFALLLPGLTALQSWLRALLMKGDATSNIYQAMGINLAVSALALGLGAALDAPGVQLAALALTVAMLIELAFLWMRARRVLEHWVGDAPE